MGSHVSCLMHVVFSTKKREPWIDEQWRPRLWMYMGGVARKNRLKARAIGGTEDHVHALISFPSIKAIADGVREFKAGSSLWVHENIDGAGKFAWQEGYGAFSVSCDRVQQVSRYISNQAAHHRKRTFQEEYVEFLEAHGIEYDKRYIWK